MSVGVHTYMGLCFHMCVWLDESVGGNMCVGALVCVFLGMCLLIDVSVCVSAAGWMSTCECVFLSIGVTREGCVCVRVCACGDGCVGLCRAGLTSGPFYCSGWPQPALPSWAHLLAQFFSLHQRSPGSQLCLQPPHRSLPGFQPFSQGSRPSTGEAETTLRDISTF